MVKTYCKPLKRGTFWRSQNFGDNKTIYGPHTGNDEACNIGTPVHAAGDGVIEFAGEFDNSYADNLLWLLRMGGNVMVLNCGDDEPSFVYAHLSRFHVKQGQRVSKGQVIADSGNSGTATTGAHLHVEAIPPGYNLNSPLLGRVDPDLYLTEWTDDVMVISEQSATTNKDEEMPDIEEIRKVVRAEVDAALVTMLDPKHDRRAGDGLSWSLWMERMIPGFNGDVSAAARLAGIDQGVSVLIPALIKSLNAVNEGKETFTEESFKEILREVLEAKTIEVTIK